MDITTRVRVDGAMLTSLQPSELHGCSRHDFQYSIGAVLQDGRPADIETVNQNNNTKRLMSSVIEKLIAIFFV